MLDVDTDRPQYLSPEFEPYKRLCGESDRYSFGSSYVSSAGGSPFNPASPAPSSTGHGVSPSSDLGVDFSRSKPSSEKHGYADANAVVSRDHDHGEICLGMVRQSCFQLLYVMLNIQVECEFEIQPPLDLPQDGNKYINIPLLAKTHPSPTLEIYECSFPHSLFGKARFPGDVLGTLIQSALARGQAVSSNPPVYDTCQHKAPVKAIRIWINLYSTPRNAEKCGEFLSANQTYLQHPEYPDPGLPYRNPHILSKEFWITTRCESQGGISTLVLANEPDQPKAHLVDAVDTLQIFGRLDGGEALWEMEPDERITTTLLPWVFLTSNIVVA